MAWNGWIGCGLALFLGQLFLGNARTHCQTNTVQVDQDLLYEPGIGKGTLGTNQECWWLQL